MTALRVMELQARPYTFSLPNLLRHVVRLDEGELKHPYVGHGKRASALTPHAASISQMDTIRR